VGYVYGNTMLAVAQTDTYDHRTLKTRLPVRSALFKQRTGGLVVRWVTTSEYPLLYVFVFFFLERNSPNHLASSRYTDSCSVSFALANVSL
jgi:hypothetical protein